MRIMPRNARELTIYYKKDEETGEQKEPVSILGNLQAINSGIQIVATGSVIKETLMLYVNPEDYELMDEGDRFSFDPMKSSYYSAEYEITTKAPQTVHTKYFKVRLLQVG